LPWESLGREWREMEVIAWGDDMVGWLVVCLLEFML
jgi:hypothetical protein